MQINQTLGFIFGTPGIGELLLLAAVGLLIFGKRLPEVGRSMGKGIVEFKKGLSGIENDINNPAAAKTNPQPQDPKQTDPAPSVDITTPPQPPPSTMTSSNEPRP